MTEQHSETHSSTPFTTTTRVRTPNQHWWGADFSIDSVFNVVALTPKDPLDSFVEMWYQIFLWAVFSSIFFHLIAAAVAVCMLRKHTLGRWYPLAIAVMGILGPLTGGVITSAVIAWSYKQSSAEMPPLYAMLAGLVQTILCILISFLRIPATL